MIQETITLSKMKFDFLKRIFVSDEEVLSTHSVGSEKRSSSQVVNIRSNLSISFSPFSLNEPKPSSYQVDANKTDIYTSAEFERTFSGTTISHDVVIRNGPISSLAPVTDIHGTLGLSDCKLESLSPLMWVKGDLWCSFRCRKPLLKELGTLQRVEGNANFRYVPLESLGSLRYVGGDLSLRDTKVRDLGKLEFVGGNLNLPKRLKGVLNLDSITIMGEVKYWNDQKPDNIHVDFDGNVLQESEIPVPYWPHSYIYPDHTMLGEPADVMAFYRYFLNKFEDGVLLDAEGHSNYYFQLMYDLQRKYTDPDVLASKYSLLCKGFPKAKMYCEDILLDLFLSHQEYDKAWNIVNSRDCITLKQLYYYIDKLGESIFDGNLAIKMAHTNCLTSYGRSHVAEIVPFFTKALSNYEKRKGCRFYDLFYTGDLGYKEVNGKYEPDYYKEFYRLHEQDFYDYKAIGSDGYHMARLDDILLVEHAVEAQLRILLIESEDLYRESLGLPKIGEGWINETALFYKIKEHYNKNAYEVVHHGHPKWLGQQHLDIYIKDVNVGIEYQGIQHYQPVDYFGGSKGFEKTKERDERKRKLCADNHCPLIYVDEGYDFNEVVKSIDAVIEA